MPILIFAILVRIFANPFSNVFQKKLTMSGVHPLWVNFVSFFLLSVVCIVPAFSVDWPSFSPMFWAICAVAGLLSAFGNGFLVRALQLGDLSVLGPINAYKSVVSMIVGIFVLREIPGVWGIAGIAMIIFGSYFVLDTMDERFSWKVFLRKEIQFRLWAMILTAVEAIFIKQIIVMSNVTVSFIVWSWFGALFSVLILPVFGVKPMTQLRRSNNHSLWIFLALALTIGITQFTTNFVFNRMNVSYALALFQLSSIVTILLGWRIFKEKHIGKKLVGGVIMIVGAVVIILMK